MPTKDSPPNGARGTDATNGETAPDADADADADVDTDDTPGGRQTNIGLFNGEDVESTADESTNRAVTEIDAATDAALEGDADELRGDTTDADGGQLLPAAGDPEGNYVFQENTGDTLNSDYFVHPDSSVGADASVKEYVEYLATHAEQLGVPEDAAAEGLDVRPDAVERTTDPQYDVAPDAKAAPEGYDAAVTSLGDVTPEDITDVTHNGGGFRSVDQGTITDSHPVAPDETVYLATYAELQNTDHHPRRELFEQERAGFVALEELGYRTPRMAFFERTTDEREWEGISLSLEVSGVEMGEKRRHGERITDGVDADMDQLRHHLAGHIIVGNNDASTDNMSFTDGEGPEEVPGGAPTAEDHEDGYAVCFDIDRSLHSIDNRLRSTFVSAAKREGPSSEELVTTTERVAAGIMGSERYERAVTNVAAVDEYDAKQLAYNIAWLATKADVARNSI